MVSVALFGGLLFGQDQGFTVPPPTALPVSSGKLAFVAAPGTTRTFKLEVQLTLDNSDLTYTATLDQKVESNQEQSYIISSQQRDGVLRQGSSEITYAPQKSKVTYERSGVAKLIEGADITNDDYRFQRLNMVLWPKGDLKLKDVWELELPAEPAKGMPPVNARFSLLSFDKILGRDCAKIGFEIKELGGAAPGNSRGTTWIELSTGMTVRTIADMSNAPIAQQAVKARWSLTLTTPA